MTNFSTAPQEPIWTWEPARGRTRPVLVSRRRAGPLSGSIASPVRTSPWRICLLTVCVAAAILAGTPPGTVGTALAAPGDLDTTFNGTGSVLLEGHGDTTSVGVQAVDSNVDKIVVGTEKDTSGGALVRLTANGDLDLSFGNNGVVDRRVADLAVQSDDAIVTVDGTAGTGLTVHRFTPNGSPDSSFDGDGRATVVFPGFSSAAATTVAVSPTGRIVVGGWVQNAVVCSSGICLGVAESVVMRLLPDGTLDPSFGIDGRVLLDSYAAYASPVDITVAPDDSVAVTGTASGIGTPHGYEPTAVVSRLRPDGTPDPTFGVMGVAYTGPATARSVLIDDREGVVVAGVGDGMHVARFLPDGSLDASFGKGGVVLWPDGCSGDSSCAGAESVVFAPPSDNRSSAWLVAAGWINDPDHYQHLAAVALDARTGDVDKDFGSGGSVTPGPEVSKARAAALDTQGRLVLGGMRYGDSILVYRYLLQ